MIVTRLCRGCVPSVGQRNMVDANGQVLPLLITVEPKADESLLSLLVRTADANVLGRLECLQSVAGITNVRPEYIAFTGASHTEALAGLLGLRPSEVSNRMHPSWRDTNLPDQVDWHGTPLPRRWIEVRTVRFSPSGLLDQVHHRDVWSIKPLRYCPHSMELLVDLCGGCGIKMRWSKAKSTTHCSGCGLPLNSQAGQLLTAELQRDAREVAALVDVDRAIRSQAMTRVPAPFSSWEPGSVFHAAVELGFVANNPVPRDGCNRWKLMQRGSFEDYTTADLISGYRFIRQWPYSLDQHLGRLVDGQAGNIRTQLGSLKKYFSNERANNPLTRLLRDAIPQSLLQYNLPVKTNQIARKGMPQGGTMLTSTEVTKTFSIGKPVLARLSTSRKCCISKSNTHRLVLYDRSAVEAAIGVWRSSLTMGRVSSVLGVPSYSVDALIRAGLIEEVFEPDALLLSSGERLVTQKSLNFLVAGLEARLIDSSAAASHEPFPVAMRGVLHSESWLAAVKMLLSGEIKVSTNPKGGPTILGRLLVQAGMLEAVRETDRQLPPSDARVSALTASKLLNVTPSLIGGAARLGLINMKKVGARTEVALSEIRLFDKKYVGSLEVAESTGMSRMRFSALARANGLQPAAKIYNNFIWLRADIAAIDLSRLK